MIKRAAYLSQTEINQIKHNIVLYGAGTQSTGMILMALRGDYEHRPDFAVFADTGAEPKAVIEYKDYFSYYCKKEFDFDIHTVQFGNLKKDVVDFVDGKKKRVSAIPLRTETGLLKRQCTNDYKIIPATKETKKRIGIKRKNKDQTNSVAKWFGYSIDELQRLKISQEWWSLNVFPLVEKGMKRQDTINYVMSHGLEEPPRSACLFCPFHSREYWKWQKDNHPSEFIEAVEFDKKIRNYPGLKQKSYLHRDLIPLSEVDFDSQTDVIDMIEECEGGCGV